MHKRRSWHYRQSFTTSQRYIAILVKPAVYAGLTRFIFSRKIFFSKGYKFTEWITSVPIWWRNLPAATNELHQLATGGCITRARDQIAVLLLTVHGATVMEIAVGGLGCMNTRC